MSAFAGLAGLRARMTAAEPVAPAVAETAAQIRAAILAAHAAAAGPRPDGNRRPAREWDAALWAAERAHPTLGATAQAEVAARMAAQSAEVAAMAAAGRAYAQSCRIGGAGDPVAELAARHDREAPALRAEWLARD